MIPRELAAAHAAMPLVLKGITGFFAAFGTGSLLLALVPGVEHRVGGARLDMAAFFATGHGVLALVMGAWLAAAAWGLLRRAGWARWAVVGAWLPLAAGEAWLAEPPRVAFQAAVAAVWAAGTAAYLFGTRGAVAYFRARGPGPGAS